MHVGQATGLVAGTLDISPSDARALIDDHASRSVLTLRGLARAITDGSVHPDELLADSQAQRRQDF
ncbi:hypothetical protein [Rhodococcus sp. NPDC056516]|uniref:hypothetical protein n=1 Tax=Rhodococcus sp. NPDC056516 TaxID=3345847 RepID=UPI00366FF5D3